MRLILLSPHAWGFTPIVVSENIDDGAFLHMRGDLPKVVVADEIHAYDAYMDESIKATINNCYLTDTPMVIMSATLPAYKKEAFISQIPGVKKHEALDEEHCAKITIVTKNGYVEEYICNPASKDTKITFRLVDSFDCKKAAETVIKKINASGGCACVIANTVSDAQNIYTELKTVIKEDVDLTLINGRMTVERKGELTNQLVKKFGKDRSSRPHKAIVISTQIVEQSMDVDFDYLFTFIAPIDLLIQRMGRWHRHSDLGTVRESSDVGTSVYIFVPEKNDFAANGVVYQRLLLQRTFNLLKNNTEDGLVLPSGSPLYVNEVYSDETKKDRALEIKAKPKIEKLIKSDDFRFLNSGFIPKAETRYSELTSIKVILADETLYNRIKDEDYDFSFCANLLHNKAINTYREKAEPFMEEYENIENPKCLPDCIVFLAPEQSMTAGDKSMSYIDEYGLRLDM